MAAVLRAAARRRAMRARALAVLALAAAGIAGSASAASAHATLESTSPRADAVVQAPLSTVRLTFDEAVGTPAFIAVTGPQGRVDTGNTTVNAAVVSVGLKNSLPSGRYTVAFRVISDDGHPVESSYTFQLKAAAGASSAPSASPLAVGPSAPTTSAAAAAATPAAAPGSSSQDHSGHWFMGVAGVAMVLAGAGALVWERRHRSGDEDEEDQLEPTTAGSSGRP